MLASVFGFWLQHLVCGFGLTLTNEFWLQHLDFGFSIRVLVSVIGFWLHLLDFGLWLQLFWLWLWSDSNYWILASVVEFWFQHSDFGFSNWILASSVGFWLQYLDVGFSIWILASAFGLWFKHLDCGFNVRILASAFELWLQFDSNYWVLGSALGFWLQDLNFGFMTPALNFGYSFWIYKLKKSCLNLLFNNGWSLVFLVDDWASNVVRNVYFLKKGVKVVLKRAWSFFKTQKKQQEAWERGYGVVKHDQAYGIHFGSATVWSLFGILLVKLIVMPLWKSLGYCGECHNLGRDHFFGNQFAFNFYLDTKKPC